MNFSVRRTLNVDYRKGTTLLYQANHEANAIGNDVHTRSKAKGEETHKKCYKHYSTRNHQIALEDNCIRIKENYKHVHGVNVNAFVIEIEKALCCIRKHSNSKQRAQTYVAKMEHSHRRGEPFKTLPT